MNDINELFRSLRHPRSSFRRFRSRRFGDYPEQIRTGVIDRPNYGYCLHEAAKLALKLGHRRISAIEFGVAGGNGLVAMEYHARRIRELIPVDISIYGFDTGEGLPEPVDYRDLMHQWKQGFYRMDLGALRKRLSLATLVIGNVSDTLKDFVGKYDPPPIGAISFDLDFYSSTKAALEILRGPASSLLPRAFCYFDDTIGTELELYSDYTGQRLAINEYNAEPGQRKLGLPYHFHNQDIAGIWKHQIWIAHAFDHPDYTRFIADPKQELPLGRR